MSNIKLTLPTSESVCHGKQITFRAPCDCTGVTGIVINGTTYELVDTTNECISDKGNQFASGAMVSVIMDTENSRAYIQNAVGAEGSASVVELTYADYQALATKDPDTFYLVTDHNVDFEIPIDSIPISDSTNAVSSGGVYDALANKASKSVVVTSNLITSNWVGSAAPYTYTLSIDGVTENSNQEILPALTITAAQLESLQGANIQDGGQASNTIILKAYGDKPAIDLPIRVIKRGD